MAAEQVSEKKWQDKKAHGDERGFNGDWDKEVKRQRKNEEPFKRAVAPINEGPKIEDLLPPLPAPAEHPELEDLATPPVPAEHPDLADLAMPPVPAERPELPDLYTHYSDIFTPGGIPLRTPPQWDDRPLTIFPTPANERPDFRHLSFGPNGPFPTEAPFTPHWQPLQAPANPEAPFADDYSKYFKDENLPGRDGSIENLAIEKLMQQYKDSERGSNERKYYELMVAKYMLSNGYVGNGVDSPISKEEIEQYVLDPALVDAEIERLNGNQEFQEKMKGDTARILDGIIRDHFVMVDGKITLKQGHLPGHIDAARVDLQTFARAGLNYAKSQKGIAEYSSMTPADRQKFIAQHFQFASYLPQEDVTAAFNEFVVGSSVLPVLNTKLEEISDEDLALALEVAGGWVATARAPTNFIGNVSSVTKDQWLALARAMKAASLEGMVTNFDNVYNHLPDNVKGAFEGWRSIAARGTWGALAGTAGIAGAIIKYTADGPARDRLANGDSREIMSMMQNLSLVLSYSTSIIKGPANLFASIGMPGAQWLVDEINSLPGFGRLAGSMSEELRPTFEQISLYLHSVDLTDETAVKTALAGLSDDVKARIGADIGYDIDGLAKQISDAAKSGDPADFGITSFIINDDEKLLGFLFDVTKVDTDYKNFVIADEILTNFHGDIPDSETLFDILTRDNKMTPQAAQRVIDEVHLAGANGAALPNVEGVTSFQDYYNSLLGTRNPRVRIAARMGYEETTFPVDALPQNNLPASIWEQYNTRNPQLGEIKLPNQHANKVPGLLLKGFGSLMDVVGGLLGVGVGIHDIITGAKDADPAQIAAGSLSIASGALGFLGGLAGFGILATSLATPLFVLAGVFGIIGIIISSLSDMRPNGEKFSETLLHEIRDSGGVRPGANEWLQRWYYQHEMRFDQLPTM